jgi:hypothetical protein
MCSCERIYDISWRRMMCISDIFNENYRNKKLFCQKLIFSTGAENFDIEKEM